MCDIRYQDVVKLRIVKTEFDIEGYPDPTLHAAGSGRATAPGTLVPDAPGVITSNAALSRRRRTMPTDL